MYTYYYKFKSDNRVEKLLLKEKEMKYSTPQRQAAAIPGIK
jgi:hypothetical protein